jgi:hypothetical protein
MLNIIEILITPSNLALSFAKYSRTRSSFAARNKNGLRIGGISPNEVLFFDFVLCWFSCECHKAFLRSAEDVTIFIG